MYGFDEWAGSGSWACVGLIDTAFDGEVARSAWEVPAKGRSLEVGNCRHGCYQTAVPPWILRTPISNSSHDSFFSKLKRTRNQLHHRSNNVLHTLFQDSWR